MKNEKGIALIITLLVALVLFISIITISSSLSVSSKRVTTDQKVSLEAQYAAESGLALASAEIPRVGNEVATVLSRHRALIFPNGTQWSTVSGYVQKFCGRGVGLSPPDGTKHVICQANLSRVKWSRGNEPYKVLEDYTNQSVYPIDPDTGRKYAAHKYWSQRIGLHTVQKTVKPGAAGAASSGYSVSYGFVPMRAVATPDGAVHLVFKAVATSLGKVEKGSNVLSAHKIKKEFKEMLEVILSPPSFSHYMSFTNYQYRRDKDGIHRIFFYGGTLFDGPVHTNEHFNFIGSPWFGDEVTSAGCTRESRDKKSCLARTPAFYYWDKARRKAVRTPAPPDNFPPYTDPVYAKNPVWNDDYIPLPDNGDAQERAAKDSGLYLEDEYSNVGDFNVEGIVLSIGTESGKEYQYIQVQGQRLTSITYSYGHCERNGGGGGGGGGGTGPDVLLPRLPLQILHAGTPRTAMSHWLLGAYNIRHLVGSFLAQSHTCPPGYHWHAYSHPREVKHGSWETHSYRVDKSGRMEKLDHGVWVLYRQHFNGVIFSGRYDLYSAGNQGLPTGNRPWNTHNPRRLVSSPSNCNYVHTEWKGKHYCIEPSIAKFSHITVAGHWIGLDRDITYEERPCSSAPKRKADGTVTPAVCNNKNADNILGIYADKYDIRIGPRAPANMFIDAVLMAGKQRVYYSRWKDGKPMGDLHLTGGIIQNWYGRFGRLNPDLTVKSGYGRKFTYDPRLRDGSLVPPYFPTFGTGRWVGAAKFKNTGGGSGFWTPVEGN